MQHYFRYMVIYSHAITQACSVKMAGHWPRPRFIKGGAVASRLVRSSPDWVVRVQPWPGTLCCVLGHDTLLSQCLSESPRCINYWGNPAIMGLASHPEGRGSTPCRFMLRKPGLAPTWWATWLICKLDVLTLTVSQFINTHKNIVQPQHLRSFVFDEFFQSINNKEIIHLHHNDQYLLRGASHHCRSP